MPTIDDLFNLPPDGWKKIGEMNPEELDIYLKDVTSLEPRPVAPNIVPVTPEDEESIDKESPLEGTLDKLKADCADPDSPFAKRKKKAKGKKGKSVDMDEAEFDDMLKELGVEKPN